MRVRILLTVVFCSLIGISACKHKLVDQPEPVDDYGNFPEAVGKIFITKCATAGCHNDKSYTGAGDLRLDRWDHMFSGAKNGAPVVPYSPEQSSLLFFINTDSTLGLTAPASQMPKDAPPLSREEYLIIRDWVANGAPDKDGNVPFASNPSTRQKIYITQQGCDLIAVVDAEKKMVMRYIKVGMDDSRTEAPHNVKFTADGKYAYVCFSTGNYLQKIDATTDQVVGSVQLGNGMSGSSSFNVLSISPDGTQVVVSDWVKNGNMVLVDAVNMRVLINYNGIMTNPHGVVANRSFDTFFVTNQSGNIIYRLSKDGDLKVISLDGNPPTTVSTNSTPDPHDLVMAPDYSKYFVTCQGSNQVKVVDAHSDKILATIPVGKFPQELAVSAKTKKVFVTCMQGPSTAGALFSGNVYAIDLDPPYRTEIIEAKFSGPHGVAVDDINGFLYVSSTNTIGPAPHHPSACAGNNGYYQVFDMNNGYAPYTGVDRRYETSVQPYSVDARFKKAN